MKAYFAIAAAFLVNSTSIGDNEYTEPQMNYESLYACYWFPICTEPTNPQKRETVKPDSSSKDKKDQKASGRMA